MSTQPNSLGLIAGSRSLPLVIAQEARAQGVQKLVAIGFEGETDPKLAAKVDTGLKYLDEFATPDGGGAEPEEGGS